MTFNFDNTKKDILGKLDKSNVGGWDERIVSLCEMINSCDDYFTTSSCSGRITMIVDEDKKSSDVFLFRSHDKISFEELKHAVTNAASRVSEGLVFFKQEPCLVVVSCRDRDCQWKLFNEARNNGWKKSGILSLDKKFLIELMSSERIEFPVVLNGRVLVDDEFLRVVVEKANRNLEKIWKRILELEKLFK
jgi:tRNA wybutosine-synthesizing protein 3